MMRILIISHYIAPMQAIASIRWTKIAKYVKRKHDAEITVLTTKKDYKSENPFDEKIVRDELLAKDLVYFDDYVEFKSGGLRNAFFRIKRFMSHNHSGSGNVPSSTDKGMSGTEVYARPGIKHTVSNLLHKIGDDEIVRNGYRAWRKTKKRYDVIISTYSPVWPHLLAKKIAKKNPEAFWLADFRDAYAGNPLETLRDFTKHKLFVSRELKNASVITKVVPGIELFEAPGQKVVTLSNGYDGEEKRQPEKPPVFSLVFTGTYYAKETSFQLVFRAVRELIDEGRIKKEDIKVIFAGNRGQLFDDEVKEAGISDVSVNLGLIPREQALQLQREAAVLLQSCYYAKTSKTLWSGKTLEYVMAEKPIIISVLGNTPSEQYELAPKFGGIAVEAYREQESYGPMKEYLLGKYREWKETGNVTITRDEEYCRSFSYEGVADLFWDIVNGKA